MLKNTISKSPKDLKRRSVVLGIIILASTLLILANAYTLYITSAVRSYVNGESLYTKGQKDGTRYLLMYLSTRNERYWMNFNTDIQIPIGDSLARVAATNGAEDDVIRKGFLQGRNHVEDVESMIWLFHNFKGVPFMKSAIQLWKEADEGVGQLVVLGNEIHAQYEKLDPSPEMKQVWTNQIEQISAELNDNENAFSEVLGVGARKINRYLFYINIFFTLLIIGSAGQYSSGMIRRLSVVNDKLKRTLDFGGLTSGLFDFKRMELILNPDLLNILDINPIAARRMTLKDFLQQFVPAEDRLVVYQKLEGFSLKKYPAEIDMEFRVHTIKKEEKVLRLKALASGSHAFAIVQDITSLRKLELDSLALKVKEKEEERQRVANLIEGQELERARLSREMHDGLGQLLSAIQFNLECLTDANLTLVKDKVMRLISETLTESKRISANLLPLKLMDFDLTTCVSSLCEQVNSEKIKVVFQTKPFRDDYAAQLRLTLYRIIQEGVQNAVKHSGCSQIFVQMYHDESGLQISIEDDGKGFDKALEMHGGHGLRNIRYRTEVLNGKLEIESNAKIGTLLSISVPLKLAV